MGKTRDLRETVERELSGDPILGTADITVENIDGDVALCGVVRSYPQYLEAAAADDALTANATVPPGVRAVARGGALTLTGAVSFHSQRLAAEKAVSGLTGVRGVKDEIELVFDVDPADVRRRVKTALRGSALVPDDSDVVVVTSGNTVTLIGHVRTRAERDAVVGAAWRGHGVMAVVDEIEITARPR
jgi:osmotically-inducible protein OsmY